MRRHVKHGIYIFFFCARARLGIHLGDMIYPRGNAEAVNRKKIFIHLEARVGRIGHHVHTRIALVSARFTIANNRNWRKKLSSEQPRSTFQR